MCCCTRRLDDCSPVELRLDFVTPVFDNVDPGKAGEDVTPRAKLIFRTTVLLEICGELMVILKFGLLKRSLGERDFTFPASTASVHSWLFVGMYSLGQLRSYPLFAAPSIQNPKHEPDVQHPDTSYVLLCHSAKVGTPEEHDGPLHSLHMIRLSPRVILSKPNPASLNIKPELLLVTPHLLHHNRMGFARGQILREQAIHGLQWYPFGFWEQEPHKCNAANHQARKEKVDSVAHGREHLSREPRHEEVEEPVRGSREGLTQRSHGRWEHLRVVDPGRAVPGGRVEDGPQVEEGHGRDAAGRQTAIRGRVVGRVGDLDVGAYVVQTNGAAESTVHQEVPTAEVIDEEEKPYDCHDCLDDTKDSSGEQRGVGACDADGLENGGRIVIDGVDPGRVLPEEERTAQEETVSNSTVLDKGFERLPEAEADCALLMFEGRVNGGYFFEHVDVIRMKLSQPAQVLQSLGTLVSGHEPPR